MAKRESNKAKAYTTISDIDKRLEELGEILVETSYDKTGYYAGVPGTTKKGYNKYVKAFRESQKLMGVRSDLIKKQIEAKKNSSPAASKTFVNSYGEATTRIITSPIYERAMKRQHKAVLRNMGY